MEAGLRGEEGQGREGGERKDRGEREGRGRRSEISNFLSLGVDVYSCIVCVCVWGGGEESMVRVCVGRMCYILRMVTALLSPSSLGSWR